MNLQSRPDWSTHENCSRKWRDLAVGKDFLPLLRSIPVAIHFYCILLRPFNVSGHRPGSYTSYLQATIIVVIVTLSLPSKMDEDFVNFYNLELSVYFCEISLLYI